MKWTQDGSGNWVRDSVSLKSTGKEAAAPTATFPAPSIIPAINSKMETKDAITPSYTLANTTMPSTGTLPATSKALAAQGRMTSERTTSNFGLRRTLGTSTILTRTGRLGERRTLTLLLTACALDRVRRGE